MKKLLAIVLALAMVLPMVLSASAAQYPALEEKDDQQLYDENLGEFYDMYMEALECMDVDQRYALEALAEAKLLQTSVLLPTTSNYGNFAIGRTVPKTATGPVDAPEKRPSVIRAMARPNSLSVLMASLV